MESQDNLVPTPQSSILDSAVKALGSEEKGQAAVANPHAVGSLDKFDRQDETDPATAEASAQSAGDTVKDDETGIPLTSFNDIGKATAADVREALHQVIDPELGIDVIDLGLVYGIEIDEKGRAIITMTLTTPACPLTDLLEDECASTLAGLVEEFRIDWTWQPRWTLDMIRPEGREQLEAIGFNFDNMPKY
ncbi:metal-sulfur cluster assembly factor [Bifidobacterium sp. ESL0798]|uniref:metal-sulfur cluster assembly factor n=1 Tax=unclassified Bifidobacterium TaxID=2608897 RepID=UPI0023F9A47D|nr:MULTISPECIES: metal-sulfur cluster assembly factor [unclassified Bifidobacterium]WEV52345.1 metal-sulfur cluster assembly factor [Bifidobacterium sp. ESL0704]WEV74715.1 metal-sulfur cluster assembly factor [Bifidobacterium sp. ESL0798]